MAKRLSWLVSGGFLLSALALWGSSRLAWFTFPRGRDVVGSSQAWVVPTAVLALAAIAAVLALGGIARRLLGVLIAVVGVAVVAAVVAVWAGAFTPASTADGGYATPCVGGPLTALLGGVVLAAVGVVVVVWEKRLARWGATSSGTGSKDVSSDTDADLWKALDEGRDPTDPDTGE